MGTKDLWGTLWNQRADPLGSRVPDAFLEAFGKTPPRKWGLLEVSTFLTTVARSASGWEAVAAVRVLGALGEDASALERGSIRSSLISVVADGSYSPGVRIAAAEALWQMADRLAGPQVCALAEVEAVPEVKRTLEHIARVLS